MSVASSTSVRAAWGLTPVRMTSAPREPCGLRRSNEAKGDAHVHRAHAGDVQDRDLGAVGGDAFEQRLEHERGSAIVDGADEGHQDDAAGDGQERRRQLAQRFALRLDDLSLQEPPLFLGFTEIGDVGRDTADGIRLPSRVEERKLRR